MKIWELTNKIMFTKIKINDGYLPLRYLSDFYNYEVDTYTIEGATLNIVIK